MFTETVISIVTEVLLGDTLKKKKGKKVGLILKKSISANAEKKSTHSDAG